MFAKSYFGTPTEESLIQHILHNCDFVVAGSRRLRLVQRGQFGRSGFCWSRAGVPAVSICTDRVHPGFPWRWLRMYGFPGIPVRHHAAPAGQPR